MTTHRTTSRTSTTTWTTSTAIKTTTTRKKRLIENRQSVSDENINDVSKEIVKEMLKTVFS